jgi:hypothetical protein
MLGSALERFNAKWEQAPNGCWEWTASRYRTGYGIFWFNEKRTGAHRAAYAMFVGSIPEGADIHHRCENRRCVNPEHLQALSRKEHQIETPSSPCNRTHCPKGHPLTEGNLVLHRLRKGRRICLTCHRANINAGSHRWLANPANRAKSNAARARRKAEGRP